MNTSMRIWTTPLMAGAFAISALTGLLLFFDMEPGIVEPVHEWASWVIVSAAVLHLMTHWRSFTAYFRNAGSFMFIAGGLAIALLSICPWVEKQENPGKKAIKSLEAASIIDIAAVARIPADVLVLRLEHNGINVSDTEDSLEETAEKNGKDVRTLFDIIFQ
jgi:hypothetical protein